jgi:hypothetical protein
MAGTGIDYLGRARIGNQMTQNKLQTMVDCPVVSAALAVTGAAGTQKAVEIPAGAYVYKVALLCTGAVAGGSTDPNMDVGDGDDLDRYMDGITDMAANDILIAPVGTGSTVAGKPASGHYYAAADTIDVVNNATATTGTVKLMVWYYIP